MTEAIEAEAAEGIITIEHINEMLPGSETWQIEDAQTELWRKCRECGKCWKDGVWRPESQHKCPDEVVELDRHLTKRREALTARLHEASRAAKQRMIHKGQGDD